VELFTFIRLFLSSHTAVIAENLFLRKQLGLFQERKVKPRRATAATRAFMVLLSRFFNWREALVIVQPETFLKWHRTAFRTFWRWRSRRRGRPLLPKNLRELIREMAHDNPTWGEERIADELKLKFGIRVSPRTVSKYLATKRPGGGGADQRWATFVRNQATAIVACDFFISVTLTFRVLYVFIAMEIGSRRILHCNVTAHPTADWTTQQFREVLDDVHPYKFVIHDHDSIFSSSVDLTLNDFGVRVLRTPVQAPTANAFCERLVGTIRRDCLDYLIPLTERHLRLTLKEFVVYYNRRRPHSALGPGTPEPILPTVPTSGHRHQLPLSHVIRSKSVLGGLHHDYWLETEAA
jgi:putative transposase